jgi:hypothetical protein
MLGRACVGGRQAAGRLHRAATTQLRRAASRLAGGCRPVDEARARPPGGAKLREAEGAGQSGGAVY